MRTGEGDRGKSGGCGGPGGCPVGGSGGTRRGFHGVGGLWVRPRVGGGLRGLGPFSRRLRPLRSSEPEGSPGHPPRLPPPTPGQELVPQGSLRLAAPGTPLFFLPPSPVTGADPAEPVPAPHPSVLLHVPPSCHRHFRGGILQRPSNSVPVPPRCHLLEPLLPFGPLKHPPQTPPMPGTGGVSLPAAPQISPSLAALLRCGVPFWRPPREPWGARGVPWPAPFVPS